MAPATEIRKGATTSRTGRCRAAADGVEVLELRHCAAEPDRARRGVDKIERNKPTEAMPVDHQMGHRTSDGSTTTWLTSPQAHRYSWRRPDRERASSLPWPSSSSLGP